MSGENNDTNMDILEARYRSRRNQATINIELAIAGSGASAGASSAPGSVGGGVGGVGGSIIIDESTTGGGPCPELGQYVLVQDDTGMAAVQVIAVQVGWFLYNPLTQGFEKVVSADIFDSPLLEISDGWITAVGSPSHPVIRSTDDTTGLALGKCGDGLSVLAFANDVIKSTAIKPIKEAGTGKVKCLKTEGPGHIYCAGSSPDEMFVFHNAKQVDENT